jgi:chemotaxis protein MotA
MHFYITAYSCFLAGYDKENLRGKLDTFINSSYQRNMVRASILNTMANVAPAFGMLGTLIGLVLMLASLDGGDSSSLGSALSVALLTTLYGTLFAQLIFKALLLGAPSKKSKSCGSRISSPQKGFYCLSVRQIRLKYKTT